MREQVAWSNYKFSKHPPLVGPYVSWEIIKAGRLQGSWALLSLGFDQLTNSSRLGSPAFLACLPACQGPVATAGFSVLNTGFNEQKLLTVSIFLDRNLTQR